MVRWEEKEKKNEVMYVTYTEIRERNLGPVATKIGVKSESMLWMDKYSWVYDRGLLRNVATQVGYLVSPTVMDYIILK